MKRARVSRMALTIALAATGSLHLAACGNGAGGEDRARATGGGTTAGVTVVAEDERRPVGEIRGETLAGQRLDVADHRGEIVVINVWASWCGPCRAEMPHLVRAAEETRSDGVRFVGINTRDNDADRAVAFEERYGATYPSLYDPTGELLLSGFPKGTLPPQGVPSTVVVDREGRVAARAVGPLSHEGLRGLIDPVLAEG
ncbi:TlpA disulfide reductase family protein [Streptomyces sp. NPDC002734]|uniref:TlpA family protein disulfide reductase n=1 Tax=Streptomyces sp. NPDC002734 TaxID=3154426 RepID=UPI003321BE2A